MFDRHQHDKFVNPGDSILKLYTIKAGHFIYFYQIDSNQGSSFEY